MLHFISCIWHALSKYRIRGLLAFSRQAIWSGILFPKQWQQIFRLLLLLLKCARYQVEVVYNKAGAVVTVGGGGGGVWIRLGQLF